MNYSKPQIILAAFLSGLSEIQSSWLCTFLDEAVKQLGTIQAETLTDFFGQFCVLNDVTEDEIRKPGRKNMKLVNLRKKFTILAKQAFPESSSKEIGEQINRDGSSVRNYFKLENIKQIKRANLERMKNGKVPFDQWPVKYELSNLLKER